MSKFLVLAFIVLVAYWGFTKVSSPSLPNIPDSEADLIMFWGDGCPHCETVKKYIDDNKLNDKLKISQKEVYYNKTNQQQLTDIAKKCPGVDTSAGIGVPFGYASKETKCLYGDKPIIDWLATSLK